MISSLAPLQLLRASAARRRGIVSFKKITLVSEFLSAPTHPPEMRVENPYTDLLVHLATEISQTGTQFRCSTC
jgi:hypothetical protein